MFKAFYVHCELPGDIPAAERAILSQDELASLTPVFSDALLVSTEMSRSEFIHALSQAHFAGHYATLICKTKPGTSPFELVPPRA